MQYSTLNAIAETRVQVTTHYWFTDPGGMESSGWAPRGGSHIYVGHPVYAYCENWAEGSEYAASRPGGISGLSTSPSPDWKLPAA